MHYMHCHYILEDLKVAATTLTFINVSITWTEKKKKMLQKIIHRSLIYLPLFLQFLYISYHYSSCAIIKLLFSAWKSVQ